MSRWGVGGITVFLTTLLATVPLQVAAQLVDVSGVVTDRSDAVAVREATVRLSGSRVYITDSDGSFRFLGVTPGLHTIIVEAFGYRSQSLDVVIQSDTLLNIELDPDPVAVDSLLVQVGDVAIKGRIKDAVTGQNVLYAQVYVHPGSRTVGALSGFFIFLGIPISQTTTLSVEAMEYLPAHISLSPERDTTLTVELWPDSISIRMMAQQVKRLKQRSNSIPLAITTFSREDMLRLGAWSADDLIRMRVAGSSPGDGKLPRIQCLFIDDLLAYPDMLVGLYAGQVERIEIYGRGKMVRVYTKRYVASLMGQQQLPSIMYSAIGLGLSCR